ncbi:MAG: hypothetical protein FJ147_07265 [Deltaproteobacteria bacterium]|nr:hypothetical protein [Deltaproteobacteria bacterium]
MNRAAIVLLIVGVLQMTGDVLGLAALRGIGAATVASPAPKVFSAARGLETYSSRFFLEWTDRAGTVHSLALTPEIYGKLAGPYNRRNVYGAALAYGPVLSTDPRTQPMFQAVIRYAFCGDAPVLKELGINPKDVAGHMQVRLDPIPGTPADLPRVLEAVCQ